MKSIDYQAVFPSPLGLLAIRTANNELYAIDFLDLERPAFVASDSNVRCIVQQLQHYFKDPYVRFTIPYRLQGTSWQQSVWQALSHIPVSQTLSYGALAEQLKTSPRAVGNACRANPLPILIPCHRVVAKNRLGGYGGCLQKQSLKAWLLQHEGFVSNILK